MLYQTQGAYMFKKGINEAASIEFAWPVLGHKVWGASQPFF